MLEKKIFIIDDVLSAEECEELIEFYMINGPTHEWISTYPMTIDMTNDFLKSKVDLIENTINDLLLEKISVDWCQIVSWPQGTGQILHHDIASANTVFTSITYLNSNYQGGKTYIVDDIEIVPKIGRTVAFDGNYYLHGVTEVTRNIRFTLPIWYKRSS